MPNQQAIWKIGTKPVALQKSSLRDEKSLEDMIVADPSIVADDWLLIGRQVQTASGGFIDLLAIAPDGSLIVLELKRHKTPRDVVAQAIDYASWVQTLEADQIWAIYEKFAPGKKLESVFRERFDVALLEETLNQSHQVVIVAAEIDASTERIISYLSDRNVAINALFFEVFRDETDEFLSRRWFVDPTTTQLNTTKVIKNREPWNGEFYVSFGASKQRSWEDAKEYGFISAGGGAWYSRTLQLLSPGDRVWVRIPGEGYVGVAEVTGIATPAGEFCVEKDGVKKLLIDVSERGDYRSRIGTEEQEWFVPVRWLNAVPRQECFNELGFFGNQNSVCRPTAAHWRHTVDRLKEHFQIS
jgi:hypothetical protein